jgi:catechol 2,3-dioxygenase-like lactoylglutathione lyase family enzyme
VPVHLGFPTWIGVVCDDFDRQRAFYGEVLGLRENEAGDDWAQFEMGPGVTFELLRRSSDPEYDARRYQVGFVVDDIRSTSDELIARGVEAITDVVEASDGAASWAYFRDPEGNVFEITERSDLP